MHVQGAYHCSKAMPCQPCLGAATHNPTAQQVLALSATRRPVIVCTASITTAEPPRLSSLTTTYLPPLSRLPGVRLAMAGAA